MEKVLRVGIRSEREKARSGEGHHPSNPDWKTGQQTGGGVISVPGSGSQPLRVVGDVQAELKEKRVT